jgi:hypothetical protein
VIKRELTAAALVLGTSVDGDGISEHLKMLNRCSLLTVTGRIVEIPACYLEGT